MKQTFKCRYCNKPVRSFTARCTCKLSLEKNIRYSRKHSKKHLEAQHKHNLEVSS